LKKGQIKIIPTQKQMMQMTKTLPLVKSLSSVSREQDDAIIRGYAMHLVDPANTNACGVPTQMNGMAPTATVDSTMSFDVSVNTLANPPPSGSVDDVGRFGFVVQPTFGDSSDPLDYKVALVDTSAGWPADLSLPTSYVRNSGSTSLTVDPQSRVMLQAPAMYYKGNGTSNVLTFGPLGDPALYNTSGPTDDPWNDKFGAAPVVQIGANSDSVTLPPGQYQIAITVDYPNANNTSSSSIVCSLVSGTASISTEAQGSISGDDSTYNVVFVVSVYKADATFRLAWNNFPNTVWIAAIFITTSWARPDQLNTPATSGYPLDGGPVRKYVPVAMSVLATFIGNEITTSGDIGCCQATGTVCETDVFTNVPRVQAGNPLKIESLRSFPIHYDGKLKDGVYQIWTPESMNDMNLMTPTEARDYSFPCLIVSGKATGQLATASLPVLRVLIYTTYQFTSDVKCFDMRLHTGSVDLAERALRLALTFPRSSPNGPHWDNIRAFARKVGAGLLKGAKFVADNQAAIGKYGALALSSL
jgi:hypothetical protein